MSKTSIIINPKTRNELRLYGKKAQTYDDIVKELLKKAIESSNGATLDDRNRRK